MFAASLLMVILSIPLERRARNVQPVSKLEDYANHKIALRGSNPSNKLLVLTSVCFRCHAALSGKFRKE